MCHNAWMTRLRTISDYLDGELAIERFTDSSNNGVQVANSGAVGKICCGVDASMGFLREAAARGADLAVCHHGISWGDSLKRITDRNYAHISLLMKHDMALYACHLPLDAHPLHGNNARICKALGLTHREPFGCYEGTMIGFSGRLPKPMRYESFKKLVQRKISPGIRTMDFGKKTIRTVAVVSGAAAEELEEAGRAGIDVYLSGEAKLTAYALAQDYSINAVFAGHYATEVFGVRALAGLLRRKFKVEAEFIDLGIEF